MSRHLNLPSTLFLTDTDRTPDPAKVIRGLPRGSGVIFRHYGIPRRAKLAKELALLCRQLHIFFIVANDWRLAVSVNADGIHLPEYATKSWHKHRVRNPNFLVTCAAHSQRSIWNAIHAGVDAVLVSPVFATVSHRKSRPLGLIQFSNMCRISPIPVYALGGIVGNNVQRLKRTACVGIAGISLFHS